MKAKIMALLLALLVTTASAAEFDLQVQQATLANGLTLLTYEDNSVPTVSVQTFVNAGSRDEDKPGATGLAHVFEHMMFRGTEKYPSYTEAVAPLGAQNNAYTGDDYTCYFINADARFLDQLLDIESDRIRNLRFTREIFRTELGPVTEERRAGVEDSPYGFIEVELYREAFRRHTYQHPVIGWKEDLEETMTFEDGLEFMNHFYVPNNCVLVIAGNVTHQAALALVEKHYSEWEPGQPYAPQIETEPPQTEERVKSFVWKDEQVSPLLRLGYHTASMRGDLPTLAALRVIEELLFSDSGRLTRLLKNELSLVESLGSDVNMRKDPGLFVLGARLRRGVELETVRDSIFSQLELLKTTPISEQELKRAVNNLRAQMIYRLDRPAGVAGWIGFAHLIGGSYTTMMRLYELYGQITPEQILAVAAATFAQSNRTLVTLMPKQAS